LLLRYLPAAHQAIPPAKTTTAAVCSPPPASDVVSASVMVTVVLARSFAYAERVIGSHITVPVCPSTTVVDVICGL
jgi:hypothetical protein